MSASEWPPASDGIHFTKVLPTPFAEPQPPYRRGPNRDPFVFRHPDGGYRMLATSELAEPPVARRGGALELLTSPDARHWTPQPPFFVPGYVGHQPECSDLFEWNGWFYLLFGQDGATHYRMSRSIDGPWRAPGQDILDSPQSRVMKTAPFTMNRRIGVSFIPEGGWGGDLVFREIVQRSDGTLGTGTPPEMVPSGQPVSGIDSSEIHVDTKGEFRAASVGSIPKDALIRMRLRSPLP